MLRRRSGTCPKFSGGDLEEATPDPIPNSEVKLFGADGTAGEALWESRTPPGLFPRNPRATRTGVSTFCSLAAANGTRKQVERGRKFKVESRTCETESRASTAAAMARAEETGSASAKIHDVGAESRPVSSRLALSTFDLRLSTSRDQSEPLSENVIPTGDGLSVPETARRCGAFDPRFLARASPAGYPGVPCVIAAGSSP